MADPPIIQLPAGAEAQHQPAVAAAGGLPGDLTSSASIVQLVQHDASRDVWQAYGLVGGQLTLLGTYAEQFDALAAAQQHQLQQLAAEQSAGVHVPSAAGLAGTSVSTPPTQQLHAQQLQVQLQQQQLQVPAAQPLAPALQQQAPAQHAPAMQQQAVAAAAGAAASATAALAAANAAVAATGGRVQPGSAASTSTTGHMMAGQAAPAHSHYADVPGLQAELSCAAEIVAVAAEAKHRQQQAMANQSALLSAQGGISIMQQQLQQLQQPSGLVSSGSIPAAGVAAPAAAHAAAGVQTGLGVAPRQGMASSHSCLDFSAMASLGSAAEPLGAAVPTLRSKSSFDAQQMQAVQLLRQQHSMRLQAQAEQQQVLLQVPAQHQQQVAQHLQPQQQPAMPHLPAQLQSQAGEVVQQGMQQDWAHPTASQMLVQQMQAQAQAQQHQQQLMFQQQMQQQQVAAMQTAASAGGVAAGAASGSAGAAAGAAATTSAFTVTTELPIVSSRAAVNPVTSAGYPAFTASMGLGTGRVPAASSSSLPSAFAGLATMPSVGPPAANVAAHAAGVVVGMPAVASAHSASLVARGSLTGLPVVQVAPGSAGLSGTTAVGATPGLASSGSIGPPVSARSGSHMGSGLVAATASTGAGGLPESRFKGVQWSVSERRWQAFWLNRAANEVVCLEAYDSEQDAAVAHDRAVLAALGPAATAADLNFPAHATYLSTQPGSATTSAAAAGGGAGGSVVTGSPWASASAAAAGGTPTSVITVTQPTPQAHQPQQQQGMHGQPLSYKGVVWDPVNLKYQAQALDSTGSVLLLGLYSTAEEAAVEYDTRLIKSGIRDESKLNFGLTRYLHLLCGTSSGVAQPAASGLSGQGSMGAHAAALAAAADVAAMQAAATDMGAMQAAAADMAAMQAAAADMAAMQAAAADMAAIAAGAGAMGVGLEASAADTEAAVDAGSAGAGAASKGKGKKGKGVQKGGKAKSTRRGNPQSQYKGVSWSASTQRWAAVIWDRVHKKARHLGVYSNEEEAARVYDRQVLITQGLSNKGLNFQDSVDLYRDLIKPDTPPEGAPNPEAQQQEAAVAAATPDTEGAAGADTGRAGTTVGKSSSYTGVSWHDRIGRWEVRCWFQGKQHFAGSFETEQEAARAYDRQIISLAGADARIQHRLNFPLSDYQAEMPSLAAARLPGLGVGALSPAAAAAGGGGGGVGLASGLELFGGGGKQAAVAAAAAAAAGGVRLSSGMEYLGGGAEQAVAAAAAPAGGGAVVWEAEAQGLAGSKRARVPSLNAEEAAAAGDASAVAAAAAGGVQFAGGAFLQQQQQQQQEEGLPGSVEVPTSADVTPFADQGWFDPELMQQLQTDQGWQQQQEQEQRVQQQQQQVHILQVQSTQQQQQQQQGQHMPLGSPQLPGTFSPQQQMPQQAGVQQQQQQQEMLLLDASDPQQQYLTPAGLEGQQQAHLQMQHELVSAGLEGQQQPQMQMQQELVPDAPSQHVQQQQQGAALGQLALQQQPGRALPVDAAAAAAGGAQGVGAVGVGAAREAAAQAAGLAESSPLLLAPSAAVQAGEGAAGGAQQIGDAQLLHPTDPQL